MYAIELNSISKTFGEVNALSEISLGVEQGQLFGLIGPDGAGKTSLLRILATLLNPTGGRAAIGGFDVVRNYRKVRRIVGYMPGRFSLYGDLTVRENLEFFAGIFGVTIANNYDVIRDIYGPLEPFDNRLASRLSGGMKQKLALSCALVHKPNVLLLDEPTTGVDAVSRKEFWEMLFRLKTEGISILVSTPYMDEATLCDRIALVERGKLLRVDTPQTIREQYPHQLLRIKSHEAHSLLQWLRKQPYCISAYMFGQAIHLAVEKNTIDVQDVKRNLELGSMFQDIAVDKMVATVEDCFMELSR